MLSTILLPALSALLCAISLPNEIFLYGLWPLGFIALIPLYIALKGASSPGRAAIIGAIFGSLQHAMISYWLFFYKDFAFWTLGTTTLAYAVIYAVAGMYGRFILGSESPNLRPFVFALGWAVLEYLKSTGFLGYPWGLIPYSLTSVPLLLQIVDRTGVYGLSFLLALSSALGAEFLAEIGARAKALGGFAVLALLLCLVAGYGVAVNASPIGEKATLRATLVQQNTDPWISGEMAALDANIALARQAFEANKNIGGLPVDLIVFSETSLRRPFAEYGQWFAKNPKNDPLLPFIAESGASLLTGAPVVLDWKDYEATNSVILVSPRGELLGSYAKIHPVPFAEAIPFWEYKWFRTFMREVVGLDSGWVMGSEYTMFPISPKASPGSRITFATPICFEDAFADLCRRYFLEGADLLINLTNDSWSRTKSAQIQHWAIARIRAIENRRTLVRSTNSGVSCVIDAKGELLYEMPQFEAAAITVDIPVYTTAQPTLYTVYGDWFARLCALLLAFRVIIDYVRFRRRIAEGSLAPTGKSALTEYIRP